MVDNIDDYIELIHSDDFFKNEEEFIQFLNIDSTEEDLCCFLKYLEAKEDFKFCQQVKNKLNERRRKQ